MNLGYFNSLMKSTPESPRSPRISECQGCELKNELSLERARIGRSGVRLSGVVPELLKGEALEFGCEFA